MTRFLHQRVAQQIQNDQAWDTLRNKTNIKREPQAGSVGFLYDDIVKFKAWFQYILWDIVAGFILKSCLYL
jgi:hypothetical protein